MSISYASTDCLYDLIGLDNLCVNIPSSSGYYISQGGITKNFLSQVLTKDYKDEEDLFIKKRDFAIETLVKNIHTHFSPKYKAYSVVDQFVTGRIQQNKVAVSSTGKYKGILFNINAPKSALDFYLSRVGFFGGYTGDLELKVIDLIQGQIIDTITIPVVADEITYVNPLKTYKALNRRLQLFICYDDTGISSYKTTLNDSTCTSCSAVDRITNAYESISSNTLVTSDAKILSSLSSSEDTGGLVITHSLQCNHTDWLCSRSNLLALPAFYKVLVEILQFALFESPHFRSNTVTSNNYDILKDKLAFCEKKFASTIKDFFESAAPPNDELCYECRRSIKSVPFSM